MEGGHKSVWQARGDGASKSCLLCKNLFTHDSNVVLEDGTHMLRCNQIKLNELEPSKASELRTNARYLQQVSTTMGKADFVALQQAIGLTYAPHGVLLEKALDRLIDPTEVYMHDYMHCLWMV